MNSRALVIEDDPDIAAAVRQHLSGMDFIVDHTTEGERGLELASINQYSLVILDLMLPGMHGIEVCRQLRASHDMPIIVLSASGGQAEKVLALELGADDFLAKPFSSREFAARISALMRRRSAAGEAGPPRLTFEKLEVDLSRRLVRYDGDERKLTAAEFDLLALLASQPGRTFSREQICSLLFGDESGSVRESISVLVNRLRGKIEAEPARPRFIQTIRGVGYRFTNPEESESGA